MRKQINERHLMNRFILTFPPTHFIKSTKNFTTSYSSADLSIKFVKFIQSINNLISFDYTEHN